MRVAEEFKYIGRIACRCHNTCEDPGSLVALGYIHAKRLFPNTQHCTSLSRSIDLTTIRPNAGMLYSILTA